MRLLFISLLIFFVSVSFAANETPAPTEPDWQNTSLSDALIQKIQQTQYQYRKCAADELQKTDYAKLDFRVATEKVLKQCEPLLSQMRETYLAEKVPAVIADRQLKKLRIQTTRNVLSELMFRTAANQSR
jgi:hypothetical protein